MVCRGVMVVEEKKGRRVTGVTNEKREIGIAMKYKQNTMEKV